MRTANRHQMLTDIPNHTNEIDKRRDQDEALSDLFGKNVFSPTVMQERLPQHVYEHMLQIRASGRAFDATHADAIASAMKEWALARGATHYCHSFHPLTGLTAEKHQSFLAIGPNGHALTEFSGKHLLQGEPDASSFPSGGIRSTFEARGYTGWDPTSDAFLIEGRFGKTLCIPSVFLGHNGQALDKKTPLLRSLDALSQQALRVLHLFGRTDARRVTTTVGCEQEYFLVDRRFFILRPDLMGVGRTLYGARPPRGQEMEDHYLGVIKPRVLTYMEDVERELYKLGIPVVTRHNEVAPSQFEFAPIFERAHVATEHNLLMMSVLRRVAPQHGLECLLHEKPFAGVNGSGKHNNWSLADDGGHNLLEPGRTPHENAQFLVFLTAIVRAIHLHADLLRASVATPANDHRLGANEAPPAIMSIYLGDQLTEIVNALISDTPIAAKPQTFIDIGVTSLPDLPRHDSDRNRTSPFAFTGSKFEFRAVGSAQNIAWPNTVLNTIVAESLNALVDQIEAEHGKGAALNDAVRTVVQRELREHCAILFNGDNYHQDWQEEAQKRGLPNLRSFVEAIPAMMTAKAKEMFAAQNVLTEEELTSRYRIKLENYIKTIGIEAALMSQIGRTMILPAAVDYQGLAVESVNGATGLLGKAAVHEQVDYVGRLSKGVGRLITALDKLDAIRVKIQPHAEDLAAAATYCHDAVIAAMEEARTAGDALELLVDDDSWPLPKYHEMLFVS
jgi:glutamine synthetase